MCIKQTPFLNKHHARVPFLALISKFIISFVVPKLFSPMDEVGTRSCQTVSKNSTCFLLRYHTVFGRFDIKRRILLLITLSAFKKGLDIGLC